MQPSHEEPLPRVIVFTAKAIRAYFEDALAEAGASLATWVVLSGIDRGRWDNQRGLARDLRIEGAGSRRRGGGDDVPPPPGREGPRGPVRPTRGPRGPSRGASRAHGDGSRAA